MEVNNYTPEALARLPREELRRILAEELNKEPAKTDDTLVRSLLAELQARGNDSAFADNDAVESACEEFRAAANKKQHPQKPWYQSWMLKVASVVLVLGILFFSLPAATEAKNTSNVLTWWSDSLLQFFRPGSRPNIEEYVYKTDHPGLQQIYNEVVEAGITTPIVPSKLSIEFQLAELKLIPMQDDVSILSCLTSDHHQIVFTAITHSTQSLFQHEKKAENIAVWNIAGIEHYVISNTDMLIITWITDNIECTITTDCPEEDVYRLICSIYTSED